MRTVHWVDELRHGILDISVDIPARCVFRLRQFAFVDNWGRGYWLRPGSGLMDFRETRLVVRRFPRTTYTYLRDDERVPALNVNGRVYYGPAYEVEDNWWRP